MMVPSNSPFSVLLKRGVVLGSPRRGAAPELLFRGSRDGVGADSIYKATFFQDVLLFFHTVYCFCTFVVCSRCGRDFWCLGF